MMSDFKFARKLEFQKMMMGTRWTAPIFEDGQGEYEITLLDDGRYKLKFPEGIHEKFEDAVQDAQDDLEARIKWAAEAAVNRIADLEKQVADLKGALKPFADHAAAWTRKGFGADNTILESHWDEGPRAEEDEPDHLDALFLKVGHLIRAEEVLENE